MNPRRGADMTWENEAVLSAEIRALLACARAVLRPDEAPGLTQALAACTDPEELCRAAVRHKMLGHLQRQVALLEKGAVDASLVDRLAELQRQSARRSLRQTGYLLRVLQLLEAAGVQAMPFKGPAWAERLYGDVTLRAWVDLDILVAHDQVLQARDVLLSAGLMDSCPFNPRIARKKRGGLGQISLSTADGDTYVELHWEITAGLSIHSLEPGPLFKRAQSLDLLGRRVLSPSDVDLLLVTCIEGTRDRWDSVERMLGLAVHVIRGGSRFWGEAVAAARTAACLRRVVVAVGHVCRVLGLPLPVEVADALDGDPGAQALLRSLTPHTLDRAATQEPRGHLTRLRWRFTSEDSLTAGVRHGAARFFTPGPEDWQGFALPARMAWLYYLVRPVRLVGKWVRRLS